ncbi:MAG: 6-carboxytetrahydropterin synthase [Flavobacteriales bacterium]|nr:6-carboxytetrahydropterin synthase [Flavobacteriales bacterium]
MVFLTRKEHFNAAHRLWREDWTAEKNFEVFGKCANPNWHGHNFDLFVTLAGQPDPETGMLMDLKHLSQIIKEHVVEVLDHKNLNLDVSFMKGKLATTEVLAMEIWKILDPLLQRPNCRLYKITLYETPNNFVEYIREGHW